MYWGWDATGKKKQTTHNKKAFNQFSKIRQCWIWLPRNIWSKIHSERCRWCPEKWFCAEFVHLSGRDGKLCNLCYFPGYFPPGAGVVDPCCPFVSTTCGKLTLHETHSSLLGGWERAQSCLPSESERDRLWVHTHGICCRSNTCWLGN